MLDDDAVPRSPLRLEALVAADGTATITTLPVDIDEQWLIDYLVVTAAASTSCAAAVYVDSVDYAHLLDATSSGGGAVAAYTPPRLLQAGQQLIVAWSGAAPGDTVALRVEYRSVAGD